MGGTGAGKSTVGNILAEMTGFQLFEVGHIVKNFYFNDTIKHYMDDNTNYEIAFTKAREYILSKGKEFITRQRLRYTDELIKKYGNDYFVKSLLIMHQHESLIIVGPRTTLEVSTIRKHMSNPFFVGLTCSSDILIKRFINREGKFMDSSSAKNIFIKRHDIEEMWGIKELMHYCDIVLSTDNRDPYLLADYIFASYIEYIIKSKQPI